MAHNHKVIQAVALAKSSMAKLISPLQPIVPPKNSFIEILNLQSTPMESRPLLAQFSNPYVEIGEYVTFIVNLDPYKEGIKLCQFSLIDRVCLNKGESTWKLIDLKKKLQGLWHLDSWRLISLGHGYSHILLYSEEER